MSVKLIELSIIIPTYHRHDVLSKTINTIAAQCTQPKEIIVIDASINFQLVTSNDFKNLDSEIIHLPAVDKGATSQRMQAYAISKFKNIGFMDDDVYLEAHCLKHLWECLTSSHKIGGVNAIITNQKYHIPGKISSCFYKLMNGERLNTYAGKCIGPGINFLPDDSAYLPDFMRVEWLNLGCTLYKKEALPDPIFKSYFHGYSTMEDLTLSLEVGQKWKLYTVKNAKIYHDSQPGAHKTNERELSKMDLFNRYMLMTQIMKKKSYVDLFKLAILQVFIGLSTRKIFSRKFIFGKIDALKEIYNL